MRDTTKIKQKAGFGSLAAFSGGVVSSLGLLAIAGWITGLHLLAGLRSDYYPMSIDTALAFVFLGTILLFHVRIQEHAGSKLFVSPIVAFISIYGLLKTVGYIANADLTFGNMLFLESKKFEPFFANRMSPVSGALIFIFGIALQLRLIFGVRHKLANAIGGLGIITLTVGFIATVGYVFGTPLLYGGGITPLAATTAIGFLFMGLGLAAIAGPESFFVRPFAGISASARLLRIFIPLTISAVLIQGYLSEKITDRYNVNHALAAALLAVAIAVLVSVVFIRLSKIIFRRLDMAVEEYKKSEEELKFRNSILSTQQEASIDGILVVDENNNIVSYNHRFVEMWGLPLELVEEKADEPVLSFVANKVADSQAFQQRIKYLYDHRWETSQEEIVLKNGLVFDRYSAPMTGSGGRYYGRVWYFRDITESNRTEKQLALLAHTLKSVVECVSVTDLHDTIIFVNNAFLKKYGYTEQEIIGKNVSVLRSPNNLPEVTRGILAATLGGGWTGELLNRTKDGRDFMISLSTSFVRDERGQIVALVGIATDISERKESENAKKLLEAQLQQAQKLESIGTLASGIAHDFNNILGIILGYSTILERLRENPKSFSESVAAIRKATQRGALLVKQLLLFARRTDALFETVSLNDIVVEIGSVVQETFPKTITLSMNLQQKLPMIVADAIQIHQVLLNLCLNARDAMANNGTLAIATKTVEGKVVSSRFAKATARQYVRIEVADTGIGMDETTRQRIFEPFFTTKSSGKGTGLGLAVVFGIVEHHGGFIDVRSVPREGTSFTVYLPVPERPLEEIRAAGKSIKEIPGGTESILIIEDEEMLRELLKACLVSKGYTVLTAEDGVRGVEVYEEHQKTIAVVLSDMGLPLLNGQDVFNRIRKINPEAKVIIASGDLEPETKARMYRAGLKGFIQKPYLNDEVLQKIREVIDTKA